MRTAFTYKSTLHAATACVRVKAIFMATNQSKSKCRLFGKELAYVLSRLRSTDTTIMHASVLELVEELER